MRGKRGRSFASKHTTHLAFVRRGDPQKQKSKKKANTCCAKRPEASGCTTRTKHYIRQFYQARVRRDRKRWPDKRSVDWSSRRASPAGRTAASCCFRLGVRHVPVGDLVADVADAGRAHPHGDDGDVGTCPSVPQARVIRPVLVVYR